MFILNEQLKINSNLPQGGRINLIFEEYVAAPLLVEGFKYSKSQSNFKRNAGPFKQEIYISKGKWNRSDGGCAFWLIFFVYAKDCNKWHQSNYGKLVLLSAIYLADRTGISNRIYFQLL